MSSELEAIRKEVLATTSAPPTPTNAISNTPTPTNSSSNTSCTSSSLVKESAVRLVAMQQPCSEKERMASIEAVSLGHGAATVEGPRPRSSTPHPTPCLAAVTATVVNHQQGPGAEDTSTEESSSARAVALEEALVLLQEQLTAKSLALAVADQRVAGMKKALELVSLAIPHPPPPLHTSCVNHSSREWSEEKDSGGCKWSVDMSLAIATESSSSPCLGVACPDSTTGTCRTVPLVENAESHLAYSLSTPPLPDGNRPNNNHDNGIDLLQYTSRHKLQQQQHQQQQQQQQQQRRQQQRRQQEVEEIATLTRQKAQLGDDILSLGSAQHHLNDDHAALTERYSVLRASTPYQHTPSTYPINTPHQHIPSAHPIHKSCQHILLTRSINTHYQPTLPLNICQHALSTHAD